MSWKDNATAAKDEIEEALQAEETEVLDHLYDAQKNLALAIGEREEEK